MVMVPESKSMPEAWSCSILASVFFWQCHCSAVLHMAGMPDNTQAIG